MKNALGILCAASAFFCAAAGADTCQDYLNAAAQAEANARVSNASDAAYQRQAAQAYRNAYNASCTGSGSSGGYSGAIPSGVDRGAAINQIMSNMMGIAAILENRRLREQAEAEEAARQAEMQRIQQEVEQAQRKAQAEREAEVAKAEDDRQRKRLSNPFENNSNQTSTNPFEQADAYPKIPGVTWWEHERVRPKPLNRPARKPEGADEVANPLTINDSRAQKKAEARQPASKAAPQKFVRAPGLYTQVECESTFAYAKGVVAYWRGQPYDQRAACDYIPAAQARPLDLNANDNGRNIAREALEALTR